MKFGEISNSDDVDFSMPFKGFGTESSSPLKDFAAYVGCSVWNRKKLKNFFPRDIKAELTYYSTQFNSVELNATFSRNFEDSQYLEWHDHTMTGFMFFPKLSHEITHVARLRDVEEPLKEFVGKVSLLGEKLGCVFAQMHDNFGLQCFDRLEAFVKHWRTTYRTPLAVEIRNGEWFADADSSARLYRLLEDYQVTNIIVDTAGRRDLLHMRLTTPIAFIRFVGVGNDDIDKKRLDSWASRIAEWKAMGLAEVYFFVHQHVEQHSPMLAGYFIETLNAVTGLNLIGPTIRNEPMEGLRS